MRGVPECTFARAAQKQNRRKKFCLNSKLKEREEHPQIFGSNMIKKTLQQFKKEILMKFLIYL